jgi:Raf kinase inhibitor-like YbhB/YbcL family protein
MKSKSLIIGFVGILLIVLAGAIFYFNSAPAAPKPVETTTKSQITVTRTLMKLTSSVFEHNQNIPSKYTCDEDDINPPLSIMEIPEGAKSLALLVDDPDAPVGDWVHWLVWNIPPTTTEIAENTTPAGIEGTTDFNRTGWGGPCPPSGTHRYFFKLYALDIELDLDTSARKADFLSTIEGHILEKTELIGLYQRT